MASSSRIIDPELFFAQAAAGPKRLGLGLFCRVALQPGDIWWLHDFEDRRYVERVLTLNELEDLPDPERQELRRLCYVDPQIRRAIICTPPFCYVNHCPRDRANSTCDDQGNSVVTKPILPGEEIVIPYDYDAVISLVWKFPEFADRLESGQLQDEKVLFQNAASFPIARDFLEEL